MESRLAIARRHVVEAEERIRRQELLLAELERDGHDTMEGKALLATMRETLALMRDEVAELEGGRA